MQMLDTMKTVELFRGLNEAQLRQLASIIHVETFDEGETILSYDQPGESMYILGGGQVEIVLSDPSGEARSALYLGQGQIFGEIALLDHGMRSASVRAAQEGTVVYALPRDAFLRVCQADTSLGYLVMRNLALDLSFKLRHKNYDETERGGP